MTNEPIALPSMADLPATAPDLSSSTGPPAHVQIEQWLMSLIDGAVLLAGDKLPKEKDLAAALGVSRMTLRQSLGSLEARGVVERIPGRQGGTFIRQPRIECDITGLAGFTEQLRQGHVRASARVISSTVVPASRAVAKALELPVEADVYEIVRVRSANREPVALERSYLPAELFPGLLEKRLTGSLYARMRRDYGLAPQAATEFLE
ncbi:MAG: GntR family transcriptional regulator, partial [Nocardioidaceae bacterium]